MGYVSANDGRRSAELTAGAAGFRTNGTSSLSTKLGVDFQADVGDVLALALQYMLVLHTLRHHAVPALRRALDTTTNKG